MQQNLYTVIPVSQGWTPAPNVEDFLNLQSLTDDEDYLTNLSGGGHTWFKIDPKTTFTYNNKGHLHHDSGACNGGWKDAKFLKPPYIQMDHNKISAQITKGIENKKACVFNGT